MYFALLAIAAHAGGHEVQAQRVDGLGASGGYLEVQITGNKPALFVNDGKTAFVCSLQVPAPRKVLLSFAETVDAVGAAVRDGRRMKFDSVGGFVSSQAPGYCRLGASTIPSPDGTAVIGALVFVYNRACFGSAGCNTEAAALTVDAESAAEVATALRWGATPAP